MVYTRVRPLRLNPTTFAVSPLPTSSVVHFSFFDRLFVRRSVGGSRPLRIHLRPSLRRPFRHAIASVRSPFRPPSRPSGVRSVPHLVRPASVPSPHHTFGVRSVPPSRPSGVDSSRAGTQSVNGASRSSVPIFVADPAVSYSNSVSPRLLPVSGRRCPLAIISQRFDGKKTVWRCYRRMPHRFQPLAEILRPPAAIRPIERHAPLSSAAVDVLQDGTHNHPEEISALRRRSRNVINADGAATHET